MKTVLVIGSWEDPQIKVSSHFADYVFLWEDWQKTWTVSVDNGDMTFWFWPRGKDFEPIKISQAHTHLYLRYGGCPSEAHDFYLALASFHEDMTGVARPQRTPTNKPAQLCHLKSLAPKSVITNMSPDDLDIELYKDLGMCKDQIVVKSMSLVRSKSSLLGHCLAPRDLLQGKRMAVPTFFQKRVTGREFKYHFYKTRGGNFDFNPEIIKSTKALDYRYESKGFETESNPEVPPKINQLAAELTQLDQLPLIDLDYIVQADGQVFVLEWNDSPESASFEARLGLKQPWFFTRVLLAPTQIFTIAPQNDRVVEIVAENHHFGPLPGSELIKLSCEEFMTRWGYILTGGSLLFHKAGKLMIPGGIYIRPVNVPKELFFEYDGLFRAVEMWQGQTFGSMVYGFHNMSKMFQTSKTLLRSRVKSQTVDSIKFPKSYFIKGEKKILDALLQKGLSLIVKSCSGQRSIVVDNEEFCQWDKSSLRSIPTLFQEAVLGPDLRVHSLKTDTCSGVFGIKVASKDAIDYRYAANRGSFEAFEVPHAVKKFVHAVHVEEKNPLVGVDFILKDETYYCLEANPTPGWNWYYNSSTCKVNHLALGILKSMGAKNIQATKEGVFHAAAL